MQGIIWGEPDLAVTMQSFCIMIAGWSSFVVLFVPLILQLPDDVGVAHMLAFILLSELLS